jgi:hypothetical protein
VHRLHTEIQPHGGAKGLVERRDARRHLADRVDDILQHSEASLGTETDLDAAVSDICREAIERAETYGEYRRNYLTVHSMKGDHMPRPWLGSFSSRVNNLSWAACSRFFACSVVLLAQPPSRAAPAVPETGNT